MAVRVDESRQDPAAVDHRLNLGRARPGEAQPSLNDPRRALCFVRQKHTADCIDRHPDLRRSSVASDIRKHTPVSMTGRPRASPRTIKPADLRYSDDI